MNLVLASGLLLTAAGLAGYVLGIRSPYPGRAFSVTAVMIGISLVATARARHREAEIARATSRNGPTAEESAAGDSVTAGGRE